jgi:hypothetical protein
MNMLPNTPIQNKEFLEAQYSAWAACDSGFDQFEAIPCRQGVNLVAYEYHKAADFYPELYIKTKQKAFASPKWIPTGKSLDIKEFQLSKPVIMRINNAAETFCKGYHLNGKVDERKFNSCMIGISNFNYNLVMKQDIGYEKAEVKSWKKIPKSKRKVVRDLVKSYIDADGDIDSYKTFDKPYKEAIRDEIEDEWRL